MSTFALPGKLTLAEAPGVLAALAGHAGGSGWQVDAAALQQFDSAALAVLLQARRQGAAGVLNAPQKLQALAQMYGVGEVLALQSSAT